jgi:uncharacterized OB-fold protein
VTTVEEGSYEKFLPEGIPSSQMPFWESLRAHDIRVQRCDRCGTYRYHPKDACPSCQSRKATWAPLSGRGTIYTYTVVRRAPSAAYASDLPYALVHATMDEGFRMAAGVAELNINDLRIGMPVRIVYDDVTPNWTLFRFTST